MGHYWAKFKRLDGKLYRFDTRIYIENVDGILENDECIGAIVGKNPGSAKPKESVLKEFCEIELKNDKLLPTVRSLIAKSESKPMGRKYVQVLNLFYLCNPNLYEAIKDFEENKNPEICYTEKNTFPWIWFMWGGYNKSLTEKKIRFKTVKSSKQFYLNNRTNKIEEGFPVDYVCAKHTQGMKHHLVVPYLEYLLK